jgi:hypothetical protein
MRAAWWRITNTELSAQKSAVILALMLLTVALQSALSAVSQPFWYDEIITVILCRLPSMSEIWAALQNAADGNPPGFFLVARLAHKLIAEDHLGYRLPSILGLLLTVFCVYLILSKRSNRLTALVGAALLLCTSLPPYAYEARPYSLMVGCIAVAILALQRVDDSKLYSFMLAFSLAAAVSLHYYAVFAWPAFFAAELTGWISHRRFRAKVWMSLLIGVLPLFCFAGLLKQLSMYYGQNYWAQPHFKQVYSTYNALLNVDSHWGVIYAIGFTVVVIWSNFIRRPGLVALRDKNMETTLVPIEELVLALTLLWLPAIAFTAAKISHGGLTERHMLTAILGCALTLGYAIDKVHIVGRLLLFMLFLANYEASAVPTLRDVMSGSLSAQREKAEQDTTALVGPLHEPGLPIVIGPELDYLPIVYYSPPDLRKSLYVIVDPSSAVAYLDTASVDLNLLALQRYYPFQADTYDGFISNHREFLLVTGGDFDWLTARLLHDGDTLRLVSGGEIGERSVYKVSVGAVSATE